MASLRLRKGVYFADYRVDGFRRRVSLRTNDERLARAMVQDIEGKIARARHLGVPFDELVAAEEAKSDNPVPAFFARFKEYCKQRYAPGNLHSDLARLRSWQEFFACKRIHYIEQITPGIVSEYMTKVLAGRQPKTLKNHLTLLKTALNYAVEWGIVRSNPVQNVKPPKITKTFNFFDNESVKRLVTEADEPLKTAIVILVNTGLRRGELFHLRWRDVDLRRKSLRVWPYKEFTPKGKEPRTIPLNKRVSKVIKGLKRDTDHVFRPYKWDGQLSVEFLSLVRKLGLDGKLHDLRHTFASHLAMDGVPIPAIKELLGHSDIRTTMIYAHLSPQIHKSAVENLRF